jgi:hypothetical protein
MSLHYRCGDHGYIHSGSYDEHCMHSSIQSNEIIDSNNKSEIVNIYDPEDVFRLPAHEESAYMTAGNPIGIGVCAKRLMHNISTDFDNNNSNDNNNFDTKNSDNMNSFSSNSKLRRSLLAPMRDIDMNARKNQKHSHTRKLRHAHTNTYTYTDTYSNTYTDKHERSLHSHSSNHMRFVAHIASDNSGSSSQLNVTLNYPYTLTSPNGCHIEMDASYECIRLTSVYWLLISLSDVMVIQVCLCLCVR